MNNVSFEIKPRAAAAVPPIKGSESDVLIKNRYVGAPLETEYDQVHSVSIFKNR